MFPIDTQALARRLHARTDTLKCHNIGHIFDEYIDRKGHCHENARNWVKLNPVDRRLHGWLIDRGAEAACGYVQFIAHSIILTSTGEFLDVTMACGEPAHPFAPAEMVAAEFDALAVDHPTIELVTNQNRFQEFLRAQNDRLAGPW